MQLIITTLNDIIPLVYLTYPFADFGATEVVLLLYHKTQSQRFSSL